MNLMSARKSILIGPVFFLFTVFVHAGAVDIREWPVPWDNTRPRDPYIDSNGHVWFCGQAGAYIAYLEPETGNFKKYDLEEGSAPHNLIVDKKGYVWFAGNVKGYIGRLSPATGEIKKYVMPDPAVKDPHTLVFDSRGDIWFTSQFSNAVGKLSVSNGEVIIIRIRTQGARPYGIAVDSRDRPWIALFGTSKLATIDPVTLKLQEIDLPDKKMRPRRLVITSNDKIWFVDYATGYLGQYDPDTGKFHMRKTPGGERAMPYAMTVDDRDRLWFVETGLDPNRLISFDPWTKDFTSVTGIPSGGGTVRNMYFHPVSREIWFGSDTNFIGRARTGPEESR